MANARVARGRRSQVLLAGRWVQSGLFPDAKPVWGSMPGKDVQDTLPFAVEVKARRDFSPLAWLKQSAANAEEGEWPIVVMRPDGLGDKSVGQWLVFMSVETFEEIVRDLQGSDFAGAELLRRVEMTKQLSPSVRLEQE